MAAPQIPARPARSQPPPTASANMAVPQIPPRPRRSVDRSISPHRDTYARSPFNDPSFLHNRNGNHQKPKDVPRRPPSVSLPSIGQEGNEYANLEDFSNNNEEAPAQTSKGIAGNLPLHAPTASLPAAAQKSRIASVTRTDSTQAAAAGIPKLFPGYNERHGSTSNKSESSNSTRPQSIHKDDEEHGIPEIGVQVPMYPNAGDVQMPTPSPFAQNTSTGVGFFNDGRSSGRHHSRTRSGREVFSGPPDSYGMHGHGVQPSNAFEKAWYEKHPDDAAREAQGAYGPAISEDRKEWALSSDDLNKLVQGSAGIGFGTSREAIGTPAEEIGFLASEQYASRMASSRPQSTLRKARTSSSHSHAESPLRKASFPTDVMDSNGSHDKRTSVVESEPDDDVIHVDPPASRHSKIHGGGYDPPTEDLGPDAGNTEEKGGWIEENGPGMPILASDEVARRPGAEFLQPAVSPELERSGNRDDYIHNDAEGVFRTGRRGSSRPSSRPGSIHGGLPGLTRMISRGDHDGTGTPLDDVKEYEPLFPDDDERQKQQGKPKTAADKVKRPDLARHHFPSQDVWEDSPEYFNLVTTVEAPQEPQEPQSAVEQKPSAIFEPPETEEARKHDLTSKDQENFLPEHTKRFAKTHFNRDVKAELPPRPGMQPRFPSQDIWEDTPDHLQLVTTVGGPQQDETDILSPESASQDTPTIPPRPAQRTGDVQEASPTKREAPNIPARPKPQVPARPAKPPPAEGSEDSPLTKTTSAGSTGSAGSDTTAQPAAPKAKPIVPQRPGGGKIAALKAGFMNDLNSRLQLGPQAPKKEVPPVQEEPAEGQEKAPLSDARKGRAKGPARRKPAASPSGAAEEAESAPAPTLSFMPMVTLFEFGEETEDMSASIETLRAEAPALSIVPEVHRPAEEVEDPLSAATEPGDESETAKVAISTSDSSVQTGQQDVELGSGDSREKFTAYLGGRAPEEGNVIIRDGEERVEDMGEKGSTEKIAGT
ncbi:hypothetical protein W97_04118 [Coniosporium apollinis CBS 100218]|uniref:Altered inheritance of mitochondria protein 21 n=1 Tax=Coniosporium apollinis (strain CBS 100218) TaxID=1168221 RepID=R7YST2_CONA1|nr:uncharacterized protein W97_04118 [Coniosporium apollinis CBS 100218]EON64884.1 hypothetical protein W97_04118 [Coniosporium apollinis CBS 100218]